MDEHQNSVNVELLQGDANPYHVFLFYLTFWHDM